MSQSSLSRLQLYKARKKQLNRDNGTNRDHIATENANGTEIPPFHVDMVHYSLNLHENGDTPIAVPLSHFNVNSLTDASEGLNGRDSDVRNASRKRDRERAIGNELVRQHEGYTTVSTPPREQRNNDAMTRYHRILQQVRRDRESAHNASLYSSPQHHSPPQQSNFSPLSHLSNSPPQQQQSLQSDNYIFALKQKNLQLQHLIYLQKSERARKDLEAKRHEEALQGQITLLTKQYNDLLISHQKLGEEYDSVKEKGFSILQQNEDKLRAQMDENVALKERMQRVDKRERALRKENAQLKQELQQQEAQMKEHSQSLQSKLQKIKLEREHFRMRLAEQENIMSQEYHTQTSEMEQLKARNKEYSDQLVHMIDTQTEHIILLEQENVESKKQLSELHDENERLQKELQDAKFDFEKLQQHYEESIVRERAASREALAQQAAHFQEASTQRDERLRRSIQDQVARFIDTHATQTQSQLLQMLSTKNRRIHAMYTRTQLVSKSLQQEREHVAQLLQEKENQVLECRGSLRALSELLRSLDGENDQLIALQKKMLSMSYGESGGTFAGTDAETNQDDTTE